jgi:hypothetical protein
MQCPICSSEAQNLTPPTLPNVVLGCGTCGDYRISGSAYDHFTRLAPAMRAEALARAKQASRHGLPMIDTGTLARAR